MKQYLTFISFLFVTSIAVAQFGGQRGTIRNRNPAPPPTDAQKEANARKVEERKQEFIANFITTLDADDFQKEIIKQTINDYFVKLVELYNIQFQHSTERKDAVRAFKKEHFLELKSLISEDDMTKIKQMIDGDFEEKEVKKKKKRKRNKRKKKDSDDDDENDN